MPNKMLIDSSHPEETRVVVVHGSRIEEFDFESQDKKQLKGNIYLARVTRVEPSLQAAFVEYGGNRHGFLAFSEIHPDYYQIPIADRQALLRAEAELAAEEDDDDGEERKGRRRRRSGRGRGDGASKSASGTDDAPEAASADDSADSSSESAAGEEAETPQDGSGTMAAAVEADVVSEAISSDNAEATSGPRETSDDHGQDDERSGDFVDSSSEEIESVGAEDALEEVHVRRKPMRRQYKIQEVIKRRQILLVQVVKEERGNKGAALTTYLSLAGRYSVLMPNTARGGGISRKITNAQDRKRLKEVVQDLEVPQGMGVILRTAGESRTKAEIKRDYEYLMRLWENVRTLTLESSAPALVYEEGNLIKRSVRDLYNKDIDEILVAGDDGYREAKDFMRMLMPSHAKVVQPYRETTPLFARYGVEAQLDKMLQPQVTLKSGGYIIINQTEALVAIDVNSGRSTKEHSIEETALHTNLEAAEEVARQLRLRDLAGLIVIDFIDMEENRNNRSVEKKLKDCLKNDRARIQLGRISHFGLMEMSRQRIRASVLESTTKPCPHCGGTGHVRSDSSVALLVVRAIEEFLLKDSRSHIIVRAPIATALYILNHKRGTLTELEARFGLTITIEPDDSLSGQHHAIARGAIVEKPVVTSIAPAGQPIEPEPEDDIVEETDEDEVTADAEPRPQASAERQDDGEPRRRKRRRRRRGGRDRERDGNGGPHGDEPAHEADSAEAGFAEDGEDEADDDGTEQPAVAAADAADAEAGNGDKKKRRRGKRGGRRNRELDATGEAKADGEERGDDVEDSAEAVNADASAQEAVEGGETAPAVVEEAAPVEAEAEAAPAKGRRRAATPRTRRTKASKAAEAEAVAEAQPAEAEPVKAEVVSETVVVEETAAPEPAAEQPVEEAKISPAPAPAPEPKVVTADPSQPKRSGWWQRKGFF
jgi:ribonuclease E